jgi:FKBP-type peptidyl-prolyl cis-trans isomerase (trigger factor)
MKAIINDLGNHEKELCVIAPWDMIKADYNDLLKKYAGLPVKGFRSGKVPINAIEAIFKSHLKNDLLTRVSTRLCRTALKAKDIVAGSPIELFESKLTKNENFEFKASFIEMPKFVLPEYNHLDLQSEDTEDKLNEISEKLLEQTDISLPDSFIDNELKYSEIQDNSLCDIERKAAAADRIKLMLILKKIAHQDNIEIDQKDIEKRIKIIAAENDVTPEELKEFLIANNGLSRLADSLLAETVLAYIIDIQDSE